MNIFRKLGKKIRGFMDKKIEACKEVLMSAQNRLVVGLLLIGGGVGIGGALVVSAFVRVPE